MRRPSTNRSCRLRSDGSERKHGGSRGAKHAKERLNVYTGDGRSVSSIEDHWLETLELPRSCLRKHTLNHMPTSSSGRKPNKLPYGVCSIRVKRSTHIVQHIYGAIREYIGSDEPRWFD